MTEVEAPWINWIVGDCVANLTSYDIMAPINPSPHPTISAVFTFASKSELKRPLFACSVSAGFPSPADDYIEGKLDLNELMVANPAATFFVCVAGDSMIGAGIHHNYILVVDRSLEPISGKVVIAVVNNELTRKTAGQNGVAVLRWDRG